VECREQWRIWNGLNAEQKTLRPDLLPNCEEPSDEI
jgi:hypothetical protein